MKNVPSNTEILENIDISKEKLQATKEDPKISREGEKIIEQTENVIEDLRELITKKNAGNRIQKILKESSKMYDDLTKTNDRWYEMRKDLNKLDTEELKRNLNDLQVNLRNLALELMRSPNFRRDVYDLFSLLYILFSPNFTQTYEEAGEPPRTAMKKETKKRKTITPTTTTGTFETDRPTPMETTPTEFSPHEQLRHEGRWPVYKNRVERFSNFETKDEVVAQFNRVLKDIGNKQATQDAFRSVLDSYYIIRNVLKDTKKEVKKAKEEVKLNPHFQNIIDLFRELLFAMTNYDTTRLWNLLRNSYYSLSRDPAIEKFVNDFSDFIKDQMKNPEKVGTEESKRRIEEFYDRGRQIGNEKVSLRRNLYQLEEELYRFFNTVQADALLSETSEDIKTLVAMLILDKDGNFTLKPEILNQLRMILFITLIQNMRYPLPEIFIDGGDSFKARLRGVILSPQEILPDTVKASNKGDLAVDLKELQKEGATPDIDKAKQRISLKLENMNFKIPNADIDFSRQKFPTVDDSGRIAINIGGSGIDLKISIYVDTKLSSDRVFEKDKVDCVVHDLDVKLFDTKHDTLYNAAVVLLKPKFKNALENYVEERIEYILDYINDFFVMQRNTIQQGVQAGAKRVLKEMETKG